MKRIAMVLLLLCACGGSKPGTGTGTGTGSSGEVGGEGAVCGCGERDEGECIAVGCRADLVCGYGCGIPGCDSTCMTHEDWELSKTIP